MSARETLPAQGRPRAAAGVVSRLGAGRTTAGGPGSPGGSGGSGGSGAPSGYGAPGGPAGSAAAILRAVLDHGPVARTAIGRATGLSPAAVSRQTAGLISLGLLRELPASSLAPR
ncbi:serine/threonine protein kinase, partial [Frankia casuarinae]|uniref:MarR family transcriptional regulator n=3 Tax=Frankia TaxID=1854 RepID=UPI000A21C936